MVRPSGTRGTGSTSVGRPTRTLSCEFVLVAGRPCDPPSRAQPASSPEHHLRKGSVDVHANYSPIAVVGFLGQQMPAQYGQLAYDRDETAGPPGPTWQDLGGGCAFARAR